MKFLSFYRRLFVDMKYRDLRADLDLRSNATVIENGDYSNSDFVIKVTCHFYEKEEYILGFNVKDRPDWKAVHYCKNCDREIAMTAQDAKKNLNYHDNGLVSIRNRSWDDQRLFEGVSKHEIKTIKAYKQEVKECSNFYPGL